MVAKIDSFEPLTRDVVMTDAYDGCYISRTDFANRQVVGLTGMCRMYDMDDSSVPEHGPLWQYASADMVSRLDDYFN